MVRVKSTGEVTEIDRKVMRILRAEEKRLRRSKQGIPISGTEGKTAEERASVLSLSYVSYEGCEDLEPYWLIEQMCEILSISTKTGYRILREGKICCLKVGRAYRIPKAHLFTFLCIGCGEAVTA